MPFSNPFDFPNPIFDAFQDFCRENYPNLVTETNVNRQDSNSNINNNVSQISDQVSSTPPMLQTPVVSQIPDQVSSTPPMLQTPVVRQIPGQVSSTSRRYNEELEELMRYPINNEALMDLVKEFRHEVSLLMVRRYQISSGFVFVGLTIYTDASHSFVERYVDLTNVVRRL